MSIVKEGLLNIPAEIYYEDFNLELLTYKELQQIAKENDMRANTKKSDLLLALSKRQFLDKCTYKELQQMAKEYGIKANMKKDDLLVALKKLQYSFSDDVYQMDNKCCTFPQNKKTAIIIFIVTLVIIITGSIIIQYNM